MPREVVPGRTYLISRRCTQRQLLMLPEPYVNRMYRYCLAESAQRYGITIHAYALLGNHHHVVVRDNEGNYPMFLAHLHKMLAKGLNRRWGRWENIFATEQPSAVYLLDDDACFRKVIYTLTNAVRHHLVECAKDWPGASALEQVLSGETLTIERPLGFFTDKSKMPKEVTLTCAPPKGFESLPPTEWRRRIREAIEGVEREARQERKKRRIRVVGRERILRAKPTSTPRSMAPRRRLRPCVASTNAALLKNAIDTLRAFRSVYRGMFERWRQRAPDVLFPAGTYKLMLFGVPCAPTIEAS